VVAFLGRGGLFSAWGLFVAGVSEVVSERHRARAFALCEMMGGSAFSFAPILAGWLYATRPVLPLAVAVALGLLMIPILLRAQRTLTALSREARAEEPASRPDPVLEPQVEPELA